jgi:hypothetical protein
VLFIKILSAVDGWSHVFLCTAHRTDYFEAVNPIGSGHLLFKLRTFNKTKNNKHGCCDACGAPEISDMAAGIAGGGCSSKSEETS